MSIPHAEASAAQANAGTAGAPFYITPRRLKGMGIVSVGTMAQLTAPTWADLGATTALSRGPLAQYRYYKELAGNLTLTDVAGTPALGDGHMLKFIGDGTNRTITIPSSFSERKGANITSFIVLANTQCTVSRLYVDGAWTILGEPEPDALVINDQTGTSYTLAVADAYSTLVRLSNSSGITLSFPADAAAAIPLKASGMFEQLGAGTVSFTPAANATVNARSNAANVAGQYGVAVWIKTAANTFLVTGDITT
jgi:hypothetical protein